MQTEEHRGCSARGCAWHVPLAAAYRGACMRTMYILYMHWGDCCGHVATVHQHSNASDEVRGDEHRRLGGEHVGRSGSHLSGDRHTKSPGLKSFRDGGTYTNYIHTHDFDEQAWEIDCFGLGYNGFRKRQWIR